MSHFSVVVVTPNGTEEEINQALAPFQEYDGQYTAFCVSNDITDEVRKGYEAAKMDVWKGEKLIIPTYEISQHHRFWRSVTDQEAELIEAEVFKHDGEIEVGGEKRRYITQKWDDTGLREARILEMPEGWVLEEINSSEFYGFAEWASRYYGYEKVQVDNPSEDYELNSRVEVDAAGDVVQVIEVTNPNGYWDWFVVGGRWKDDLLLKDGTEGDSARKDEIDFDSMNARAKAFRKGGFEVGLNRLNKFRQEKVLPQLTEEVAARQWNEFATHLENAYKAYDDLPKEGRAPFREWVVEGYPELDMYVRAGFQSMMSTPFEGGVPPQEKDIDAWLNMDRMISSYSFIDGDGEWHSKGTMGWWGISDDDMTEVEWAAHVNGLLEKVPDNHFLTIVDCHV